MVYRPRAKYSSCRCRRAAYLSEVSENPWSERVERLTIRRGNSNTDVNGVRNSSISRYHGAICSFPVRVKVSALHSSDQSSKASAVDIGKIFRAGGIDFSSNTKDRALAVLLDGSGVCCSRY